MAGNDTEGLRYATIQTPEKYYLKWVEETGDFAAEPNPLDRHLLQVCQPPRLLELIHDFVVFDAGIKKLCRQNQYFGVKAAQDFVRRREGGIIWHTQGSGKSLTMVWLAKWILAQPHRRSGADRHRPHRAGQADQGRVRRRQRGDPPHHQRRRPDRDAECHRALADRARWCTSSAARSRTKRKPLRKEPRTSSTRCAACHPASRPRATSTCSWTNATAPRAAICTLPMKALLPNAVFIGFTGTPLLKADKRKSIEVFGRYIHTYKFDQAVREGVVLDLRYEARDVDQSITSQKKIDGWFDAKTKGLNDLAKAQLKQKWGTMQTRAVQQVAAAADRGRHPAGHEHPGAPGRWPRQCDAGGRQHLRGLQVLRAVRADRAEGQVRRGQQLRAQRRRRQGRDHRRRRNRRAGQVRDLQADARRLVRRAARGGDGQGREVRGRGQEEVRRASPAR